MKLQIGEYELAAIETGRFVLDGGAMFGVVPKNLWNRTNPADDQNRIELALRTLLLKGKDRLILIDTGIGHKYDKKFKNIYNVDFSTGTLAGGFANLGTSPDNVTDVILTHLHFDHTGGTTYLDNGELKLTCPNATHHVQAEQWQWANRPSEKDRASFLKDNFSLIESSGKLNLVEGTKELFPGITVLPMYGHTPGMQLVKISDNSKTLLYCADLIPTATHIPVPWVMAFDNNPIKTISEKKEILPKAVAEKWILFFEHDPFRHAGTVELTDKGYKLGQEVNLE